MTDKCGRQRERFERQENERERKKYHEEIEIVNLETRNKY